MTMIGKEAAIDEDVTPVGHIEAALAAAEEQGMSASEVIGLLFYYAHNLAQEAREQALQAG